MPWHVSRVLIGCRLAGELMTTARWMRDFVTSHAEYRRDSVVSERVNYDLVMQCAALTSGERHDPRLMPAHHSRTNAAIPQALQRQDKLINSLQQRDRESTGS